MARLSPAHRAPSSPIAASGRGPITAEKQHSPAQYRCHSHCPLPQSRLLAPPAPGLPHLPPERFAFPLPPPFRPGCHRPQPSPLRGRDARAAACAGAPPSPHPPGQRGAPAAEESRAKPPAALPRSVPAGPSAPSPPLPPGAARARGAISRCWGEAPPGPLPGAAPWNRRPLTGTALPAHTITAWVTLGNTCDIIELNLRPNITLSTKSWH